MIVCTAVIAATGGCGAHDIDTAPAAARDIPAAYGAAPDAVPRNDAAAWYESFGDAKLAALIGEALQNNLDVAQAMARLRQAQALADQAGALRAPAVDLNASSRKSWEDGDEQQGVSEIGAALAWEIDIFNRLGAAAAADRYRRDATANELEAVRLNLAAAVAEAYYNAVAQHMQLALLRQQESTDGKLLELTQLRQREGLGTRVDVLQQQGQLADTASLIPPAEAALRVFENRLDVLLGAAPDARDRTGDADIFADTAILPAVGVPADLLLRRPDLKALRDELVAADADIAAAIAERLPRVTLDGTYALADGPSFAGPLASVIGGIVQPLLDWGRRRAEVERNRALYEEKLAAFTQAYLVAIEDVENALYRENRQRAFVQRLEERRRILEDTVGTAQDVFKQGLSDYLPVLDALKDLRVVERVLLQEKRNLVLLRIALFRAIGAPVSPSPAKGEP